MRPIPTRDIPALIHSHRCVIDGLTYHFNVDWMATEQLSDPAFPRVLLRVHVTVQGNDRDWSVGQLHVMASLEHPAQIPQLLTDALRQSLHDAAFDALSTGGTSPGSHTPGESCADANC